MDNELYHYGIPGMKWGVRRKAEDTAQSERKPSKRRLTIKQLRAARGLARSAALAGLTAYTTSKAIKFSRNLPPNARSYFNKRYWRIVGPTIAMETFMVGNNIRKLYKASRKDRENESDELRHYGIPGMKWGVRRRNFKESAKKLFRPRAIGLSEKQAQRLHLNPKQRQNVNRALGLLPAAAQAGIVYKAVKTINSIPQEDERRKASRAFWAITAPTLAGEAYLIGRGLKRNHDIKKRLKEKEEQERRRIEHGVLSSNIFGRKDTGMSYYNELYHYGVPGMKWGVRRYQNSDGSLTPAGARRYGGNASGTTSSGSSGGSGRRKIDKRKLARNIAIGVGTAAAIGGAAYGIHRLRKSGKLDEYVAKGKEVMAARRAKARDNSPYAKALNDSFASDYNSSIGPTKSGKAMGRNAGRFAELVRRGEDEVRKSVNRGMREPFNEDGSVTPGRLERYAAKGQSVLNRQAIASGKRKAQNRARFNEYVAKGREVMADRAAKSSERKAQNKAIFDRYVAKGREVMADRAAKSSERKAQNKARFNEYVAKGREVMADRAAKSVERKARNKARFNEYIANPKKAARQAAIGLGAGASGVYLGKEFAKEVKRLRNRNKRKK